MTVKPSTYEQSLPEGIPSHPSQESDPLVNAVELLPGVFVQADGSARGPGLDAALQLAADVLTLNGWACADPGMRRWYWQAYPAGAVELIMLDNQRTSEGVDRARLNPTEAKREGWHNCKRHVFASIHAVRQPLATARLAADAIRNGRIPT